MLKPSPYEQIAAWLDASIGTLPSEDVAVREAAGRVLAAEMTAPDDLPAAPVAAVDGYALSAQATIGASDYNPLLFRVTADGEPGVGTGEARPVVSGEALPAAADSVLPLEETELQGARIEVYVPLAAGDNVIPAGREAGKGNRVFGAGRILRPADTALLLEMGLATVRAIRPPRVALLATRNSGRDADTPMIRALVQMDGGVATSAADAAHDELADALAAVDADLLIVIGGSGPGPNDHVADALHRAGEIVFHGVAINPGETTTLGRSGDTPVVVLPGPPLAAMFAYDMVAGRLVRRLGGRSADLPYGSRRAVLDRKVASGLGRLECCRVRVTGERAAPLAVADSRTLSTSIRADGFVLVPERSEGFAEGEEVEVYMYDERFTRPAGPADQQRQ